jgi:hypothetical protein
MHLCRHVLSMRYLNVDGMVTANEFSEDRVIQDLENSGIHVDLNSPARAQAILHFPRPGQVSIMLSAWGITISAQPPSVFNFLQHFEISC